MTFSLSGLGPEQALQFATVQARKLVNHDLVTVDVHFTSACPIFATYSRTLPFSEYRPPSFISFKMVRASPDILNILHWGEEDKVSLAGCIMYSNALQPGVDEP